MIVACHQPNYIPWPGYFYKLKLADTFVILDSVQCPRGTSWVSRNRIKTPVGQRWLTVPVQRKGLGFQRIQDVAIDNTQGWGKKHFLSISHFYARAPYFNDYIGYFEQAYKKEWSNVADLNLTFIKQIAKWLEIDTRIVLSSELGLDSHSSELLAEICKTIGADTYLSGSGGRKYMKDEEFKKRGIDIRYCSFNPKPYPQLWGDFLPNLSSVDLLFNCGKKGFDQIFLTQSHRAHRDKGFQSKPLHTDPHR
jgi:hypothetical protein